MEVATRAHPVLLGLDEGFVDRAAGDVDRFAQWDVGGDLVEVALLIRAQAADDGREDLFPARLFHQTFQHIYFL